METAGLALKVLGFAVGLFDAGRDPQGIQRRSLEQYYGPWVGLTVSFLLPDTAAQYYRIQTTILNGNDEDAVAFRQAVTDECNMTAIAGAIIAQVAITGLSLPSLSSTPWVVRASLLVAVVSGCLSVYYACVLQRNVGKLYRPFQIRDWLRLPSPPAGDTSDNLRASLAAILIISAPFTMVKLSTSAFLIGLAIYQGSIWLLALNTVAGIGASRDVFITLVVGTGICIIFFMFTYAAKFIESLLQTLMPYGHASREIRLNSSVKLQERHQAQPQLSTEGIAIGALAKALDAAAKAHIQCAEADLLVAKEYGRAYNGPLSNPPSGASNQHLNGMV